ncbi:MAG: response regulator [Candidatus Riflebacteria bacterium]|nr:response regulator [Candidatus Riflebacteria bacterium]
MAAQILVAADDPVVVQTVSSVARAASMEPVCVPSLELARAAVTTDPPNIVVIDLSLAGSDLVPFIESLHHLNEEVELVILSLPDQVTLVVQTIRSGASDFLSKPFSNDQFAGVLRRVLNRRARRRVPIVPTAPPRVLVLEDETQKPGQAVPLLKTAGVAARAVFTVDSAWRILDAGAVDVAIVDLGAAPESRAGLFREIRIAYPAVPVIGITPATGSVPGLDTCRSEAFVLLTGTVTADTVQRAVQAASRFRLATLDRLQTRRRLDGMLAGVEHLEGLLERQQSGTAGRSLPTRDLSVRALHSLPSGVLVLDRNLLVVEANLVAERLLGINRRDLLKRPVDKLPFPPAFHKTILQTYHTGNTFSNLETELVLQGTRTVLGYAVAPMIGELGPRFASTWRRSRRSSDGPARSRATSSG